MHIDIRIPIGNPWQIMCIVAVGLWIFVPLKGHLVPAHADDEIATADEHAHDAATSGEGGDIDPRMIAQSEDTAQRERIRQAVLERREEILRYQLLVLSEEAERLKTPEALTALHEHRAKLLELIKERTTSENLLKESLIALWEAHGTMRTGEAPAGAISLAWPVEPKYGLSAKFKDDGYQKRFGLPHNAIDIPIEQGSVIRAPADGVVSVVKDNGLGYSYVTIAHGGGVESVYGHVSGFLVAQGDKVLEGDPIALSGGRPGSPGAGLLTTGPHLHFAIRVSGVLVDPLEYLTPWKGLKEFEG